MPDPQAARIRPAVVDDFDAVLALNLAFEHLTSPMDGARLADLHAHCHRHLVVDDGGVVAFLIAFREDADYDSVNYRWFDQHLARFVYIDRVVVDAAARGLGHARALYREIFELAAAAQVPYVTCEYDVEPLNEASRGFHARMGFREVARQTLQGGKQVSLQVAEIDAAS